MTKASFDYSQSSGLAEIRLRLDLLANRLDVNLAATTHPYLLEVGIGTGDSTIMLAGKYDNLTAIDFDPDVCRTVASRLQSQKVAIPKIICSAVEKYQFENFYHAIILQNVLEHIKDPVSLLVQLRNILTPTGCLYINVPLAHSLHRLMGIELGMISRPDELAKSDIEYGHHRVYTPKLLSDHIRSAKLRQLYEMPYYLKPFNTTMLRELTDAQHVALFNLGQKFPELASYYYTEAALP